MVILKAKQLAITKLIKATASLFIFLSERIKKNYNYNVVVVFYLSIYLSNICPQKIGHENRKLYQFLRKKN